MLERLHSYIGECCQEHILAAGFKPGRCGKCGESPTYKSVDKDCSCGFCTDGIWNGGY